MTKEEMINCEYLKKYHNIVNIIRSGEELLSPIILDYLRDYANVIKRRSDYTQCELCGKFEIDIFTTADDVYLCEECYKGLREN